MTSFTGKIKQELMEQKNLSERRKKALAHGLFLFGRNFSEREVSLHTENRELSRLYGRLAREYAGACAEVESGEKQRTGRAVYTVRVNPMPVRQRLVELFDRSFADMEASEDVGAFLAGVFLACGTATDPQKSYQLEFAARDEALCDRLAALLDTCIPGVKQTRRRNLYIAYYGDCEPIEDLLTLMGASRGSLAMIDVEMIKEVRNRANRVTNCETANIDKTVSAASGQLADIALIFETQGEESLSAELLAAAKLRMEHPELSLRELTELSEEPVSRSGMHHRLARLSGIAQGIRNAMEKNNV